MDASYELEVFPSRQAALAGSKGGGSGDSAMSGSARPVAVQGSGKVPGVRGEVLESSNVGFRLLQKAGWQEGTGLGLKLQGRVAPIPAHMQRGNRGIGFSSKDPHASEPARATPAGAGGLTSGGNLAVPAFGRDAAAAAAEQRQQLRSEHAAKRAKLQGIIQAELDSEDLGTKVRRLTQVARQEAEDAKTRSIRSYLSRAFNDPCGSVLSGDSNPLQRHNRLTASNPLLDDDP
ncbi:MAG: hypothetical protein WDW36_000991 [Sanguina aurantia]